MESMSFTLGDCSFALTGSSEMGERLARLLQRMQSATTEVDLDLHFVPALDSWQDRPYVRLDRCEVGEDRFRLLDRLWHVQVEPAARPVRVTIAPRKVSRLKGAVRGIKKSWRHLLVHGRGGYIHQLKRLVFGVYMPMLELALLRKASTLAHCSAIERDGRVALFPASGGVGKTSIMARYVDDGWKFLADDMCAITADGVAHLHPLPMHIYKFHEIHSPTLVQRMLKQAPAWDRLLWSALGKIRPADKLVRWVGPEQVLGAENLTWQGRVASVVYMHRYRGCDRFEVQPVAPEQLATLMASVILDEIGTLTAMSIMVNSCRSFDFLPDVGTLHQRIRQILLGAFPPAGCHCLRVPQGASAADIHAFISDKRLLEA
jgi:hypothetical protein